MTGTVVGAVAGTVVSVVAGAMAGTVGMIGRMGGSVSPGVTPGVRAESRPPQSLTKPCRLPSPGLCSRRARPAPRQEHLNSLQHGHKDPPPRPPSAQHAHHGHQHQGGPGQHTLSLCQRHPHKVTHSRPRIRHHQHPHVTSSVASGPSATKHHHKPLHSQKHLNCQHHGNDHQPLPATPASPASSPEGTRMAGNLSLLLPPRPTPVPTW